MGPGPDLPGELRGPLRVVAASGIADRPGRRTVGSPGIVSSGARRPPAFPAGAKPRRGGRLHAGQWGGASPLLDSAGRRLHARAGVVGPGVLPAGPNRSDPDRRGPRRAQDRQLVHPGEGQPTWRRGRGAVAGLGRLGAVGGELSGDGPRRHPCHLQRHRRRTAFLLPGHRTRTPADCRGLSRLSAHAGCLGRYQQHTGRRVAAALGQL